MHVTQVAGGGLHGQLVAGLLQAPELLERAGEHGGEALAGRRLRGGDHRADLGGAAEGTDQGDAGHRDAADGRGHGQPFPNCSAAW